MRVMFSFNSALIGFFYQAEDGIRDGHVTGVQTCALPISPPVFCPNCQALDEGSFTKLYKFRLVVAEDLRCFTRDWSDYHKIGRASCRERERITVAGEA